MAVTACECHASYPDASDVSGSELSCCLLRRSGPPSACTLDSLGVARRCPGALPAAGSACGWTGLSVSGIPSSACDGAAPGIAYCVYPNEQGARTLVTCIDGLWQSKACGIEGGTSHDAATIERDVVHSCPPIQVCTAACVAGRRNTTEIVNGCTVSRCCALVDGGAPLDGGDARDARTDRDEVGFGACGSCAAGSVCLETQVIGGAVREKPDDAGACPVGLHSVPESPLSCAVLPTYRCAPLPATCSPDSGIAASLHCPCASSLCNGPCSDVSPTQMRCLLLAP
jgi:hypothetical protein